MIWKLLKPDAFATSRWSGGTTTQLAIYPEASVYANRDFLWRLSSAKVEQETSVFTALPDYDRFITVLEGELDLKIGQETRTPLSPMQVRAFSGADLVESWGVCRDFNLMVRRGSCQGEMRALRFDGKTGMTAAPALPATEAFPEVFLGLYCTRGTIHVSAMDLEVSEGELLLCRSPESLCLTGSEGAAAMEVSTRSRQ